MKLTKVHSVISFNQKPWLQSYIDSNTQKRTLSNNDFGKDMYKNMNNSFSGKTMENVRKRENIDLVTNGDELKKMASKPTFKATRQFSDNLMAVHKHKLSVTLNKPIYLGFCILELSKLLMYEFFYNILVPKFEDNVNLLYMDTDSFILDIKTEDIYKDFENIKEHLDLSAYPKEHFLHDTTNKKVIGKFKDEKNGCVIKEWVAIRAKCYSYTFMSGETLNVESKLKGIQKVSLPNFEKYKDCLFNSNTYYATASAKAMPSVNAR